MSSFRVGQKVVCVNGDFSNVRSFGYGTEILPQTNEIYTIREIVPHPKYGVCLRLVEIRNEPLDYSDGVHECGFHATRFRSVVDRGTDTGLAILKKICSDAKQTELA